MKAIRKILVKILGLKGYLRLVSRIYIRLMAMGLMKKKYHELHFISEIVDEGSVILDIGANLGYYSWFMAKNMGNKGKLIAVEPIPVFAEVWRKNLRRFNKRNIHLYNCALGDEPKDGVRMTIPVVNGVVRHGLTKVVDEEESKSGDSYLDFEVPMKVGDDLMREQEIKSLDYIKCDVEGYEQYVIPSLDQTISKYKPLLQIELSGKENRQNVVDYLVKKGYQLFILKDRKLNSIQTNNIFNFDQDFYFIHEDKLEANKHLIR